MKDSDGDNLYVKGLPVDFTSEDLEALFGEHGTVVSCRLLPPQQGRDDAVGLVRMGSRMEAGSAIDVLNGAVIPACHQAAYMTVRYHGKHSEPSDNLYVKGLPAVISQDEVRAIFDEYGRVGSVRVMPPRPPATDSTALVRMSSQREAGDAIEALDGAGAPMPASTGRPLLVRFAEPPRNARAQSTGPTVVTPPTAAVRVASSSVGPVRRAAGAVVGALSVPRAGVGSVRGAVGLPPPAVAGLEVRYHGSRTAPPSDNLYVKGLPAASTTASVTRLFEACGSVRSLRVMPPRPPATDATALVRMGSVDEAGAAIWALNGHDDDVRSSRDVFRESSYQKSWESTAVKRQEPDFSRRQRTEPPKKPAWAIETETQWRPPTRLEVRYHGAVGAPPSDNVYVKGLPGNVTSREVKEVFGECGTVVSVRVMPPVPPAVDSTALVRLSSLEEAAGAIASLNGMPSVGDAEGLMEGPYEESYDHDVSQDEVAADTWLPVQMPMKTEMVIGALPRKVPPRVTSASTSLRLCVEFHGGRSAPPSDNLYVKGLPAECTEQDVRDVFSNCGSVTRLRLMPPRAGASDTTALVRMGSEEEASLAIATLHGVTLDELNLGSYGRVPVPIRPRAAPY